MICPSTRTAALGQLESFISTAGLYARDRNHVKPGHPGVSRLSPAIRHRLVTEGEVASAALRTHSFGRVEKFVQEVYWRRYWKSWLALRPAVWDEYLSAPFGHDQGICCVEECQSGNEVIDYFSNELITTGYLHNHARMWFAAWWVHEARLPWQDGAAFFFRHLLDGDPASNTLSWRWVAGLQTPGKTYLARRDNLEKYLAPELTKAFWRGLKGFENPQALEPVHVTRPPITHKELPVEKIVAGVPTGLWIHEEDLSPEHSPVAHESFSAIAVTADVGTWDRHAFPKEKRDWLTGALQDAAARAGQHWGTETSADLDEPCVDMLLRWAQSKGLVQLVALRPEVGPLADSLPALRAALAGAGVKLVLIDRPEDLRIRPFATGGFFPFWERLRKILVSDSTDRQTLLDLRS